MMRLAKTAKKAFSCQNFLCFFPVLYGAIVIGTMNIASLVVSTMEGDLLSITLKVFATCWFLLMVYKDLKWLRFVFFASYALQNITEALM